MARVLIVDDDPVVRAALEWALSDEGYQVETAADGESAVAAMSANAPDAVLLDLMLPGMDGWGVLREITRLGIRSRTRVILVTGRVQESDILLGWRHGVDEYVTKPFDVNQVVEVVAEILQAAPEQLREKRLRELEKAQLLRRIEAAFTF
ncbi:MAG: response regulator [Actinomycetota bacterium]